REIGLRRDTFAEADLIDRIGALRLLRRALTRLPRCLRLLERRQRDAGIERGELACLLALRTGLLQSCLRDGFVAADATTVENRKARRDADRPVVHAIRETREYVRREVQSLVVRDERERRNAFGARDADLRFGGANGFIELANRSAAG